MTEHKKIEAKKSLGQHFLTSEVVPKWMCDAARVTTGDIVLEVGPGTGVLTAELLKRGATVVALEADLRAVEALKETFQTEIGKGRLVLAHTDVREMDFESIPLIVDHEYKVVANIPYYLSGHLFRSFLEATIQPKSLVFLVQKEVGKRITDGIEKGGKESILSLSVKVYGTPSYVKAVSRGHFNPPPKIDSAVILVQNISRDNFKDLDPSLFFELLHIGFGQKRKQLIGNLSKHYDRNALTNIFSTLSLSVSVRAEDVPLEKWLLLSRSLALHT
jgi:16S rRNA (adenine1518-N6/adenine1519-N6)-dimethyltransferase